MTDFNTLHTQEFERQASTLLAKGYPASAGMSEEAFVALLSPLKEALNAPTFVADNDAGTLPFVIVVVSDLVATEKAMSLTDRDGKPGVTKLSPLSPPDFSVITSVALPSSSAYLLIDVDRGKETLDVRPSDALALITSKNRSPLTIDEGVAIITHFPTFLMKNNCFSLLASRHPGDQRVPAIWINGHKQANLGWCWDGNPHTWLGSASCAYRA